MDNRLVVKVIFIGCCLAGTVNCFPIPTTQIGEQKALIFGVLAFISVGAVLGACVCCRRRKRGFELNQIKDRKEFENESGVLEPARTEYPIFRAISSPERLSQQNEPINPVVANAHIIGINENIIQINEEADNNNGPLSPADMENIENNNAVDYIPNRNEIERLVEPVAISIQQEEEQQQPFLDRSNPFSEQQQTRNYDVAYSSTNNNPFVGIIDEDVVIEVEYCENQMDVMGLSHPTVSAVKLLEEASSLESSLSEKSATDVNSVEEALRALDIAISGEESFLQSNDDDFECFVTNEDDTYAHPDMVNNIAISDETKEINNKTTSVHDQNHFDEVCKEAEILVNSVLDESKSKISQGMVPTNFTLSHSYNNFDQECVIEFDKFQGKANDTNLKQQGNGVEVTEFNGQHLTRDLRSVGSVENLCFDNIVLEASTPFVRKVPNSLATDRRPSDSPIIANATFDILASSSNVFESPTVEMKKFDDDLGISLIVSETQEARLGSATTNANETFIKNEITAADQSRYSTEFIDSPLANATFDIDKEPIGISPVLIDTRQLDKTFPLDKANNNPANSTFTSSKEPFLKDAEIDPQMKCPTIKIDIEDSTSVDMTTVTPVNTPIELNYSLDSWDKFIANSMSQELVMPKHHAIEMQQPCTSAQAAYAEASTSGWFLHSKADDPPSASETFDVDDESEEDMNETFDALRKQLIIMLPHAQGVTEHPPDFSDDDDDDDTEEKPEQRSPCENVSEPQTEMIINYKRPLSPIMEESEDETCKTFVMNETKNLDSTSTGCIETGEAIMGVTKTLMASNDTLFNFEDTFGDDVFSPRTTSQNDIVKDGKVGHPDSSGASTPTPRSFKPIEFEVNEVCNVNDLLSPDQQKTLSEDICTVEHLSSDAVDTTFTTNTLDEKTCISVHIKEDEKISEISEPDWGSSGQFDLNSLNDVSSMGVMDNEDEQSQCNEFETDESSSTVDIPKNEGNAKEDHPNIHTLPNHHQHNGDDESYKDKTTNFLRNEINYSAGHYNKSSDIKTILYDNAKENTDPNSKQYDRMEVVAPMKGDDINLFAKNLTESGIFEGDLLNETDVIMQNKTFHPIDINKHHEIIPNFTLCEINNQGDQNCVMVATEMINHLSGEEDPWAHSISDIRFTGPCAEIMTTSFTANEWDSDVDDSNSSEEFMYVKGTPPNVPSPDLYKHKLEHINDSGPPVPVIVEEDVESVWTSHEDKVPVVTEVEDTDHEQYEDEDSSSDAEGEWVPSCWDSLAQPSRSALKSPDKSSSSPKKRRSVAFKKQNYHSVYEYPKEVASLSPSYSEPQLWARDLTDLFEKSSESIDDKVAENDGFSVSSSTRPFHGSQFNAQCHTWPTESNFSWSQIQDNESHNDKYPSYSELQIKWPKDLKYFICTEQANVNIEKDFTRPDSGVGESADLLSDSVTLGDLCHTKASLRLPLHNVPALLTTTGITIEAKKNSLTDQQSIDNMMIPTPSCAGSMDSLSSSSGSERQMSFSTFGKSASLSLDDDDDRINESDRKKAIVIVDEEEKLHHESECPLIQVDIDRSTKQNDSTDEDSGIESIMRVASEKI